MALLWDDPDPLFDDSQGSNVEEADIYQLHLESQIPVLFPPELTMAVSPDEAETPYPLRTRTLPTFHMFGKLSSEVRQMIWFHAIDNDPRVFEMYHPDLHIYDQSGKRISQRKVIKPRALAAACVESRNLFSEVHIGPGTYLIDFEVDTIYFGPHSFWYYRMLWRPPPRDDEERALYDGPDWELHGWERRQLWNHWRTVETIPKGEEDDDDPDQNQDQIRHEEDPYHPLLCSYWYDLERLQIRNVAFDLEFWNETAERNSGGQHDLMYMFPNVNNIILAAGDIGESMEVKRVDHGVKRPREEIYKRRLKNYVTAQMAVTYTGQVKFHPEAVPTELEPEVIDLTGEPCYYPEPVTMCVSRGGHFKGHLSRFSGERLPRELVHYKCRPDDCACDDCMYVHRVDIEEEEADNEDDLLGRGRIPSQREIEYLHDEDAKVSELEDLEELRVALNPPGKTAGEILDAVREFHASAEAGRDDDADEEDSNDDDEVVADNAPENVPEAQNNAAASEETQENAKYKPRAENEQKEAEKATQKAADKAHSLASKQTPPTDLKQEKRRPGPLPTEKVASITSSKFHYGHLKYTVTWTNDNNSTIRNDKTRYMHSEPWLQTESAQALIQAWHAAHPAEDSPAMEKPTRKAYGTVTRDGKRIERRPDAGEDVAGSSATAAKRGSRGGEGEGEEDREDSPLSSVPSSLPGDMVDDEMETETEKKAINAGSGATSAAPKSSSSQSSPESQLHTPYTPCNRIRMNTMDK